MTIWYQLRGELRKLTHPLVGVTFVAIAASICYLQLTHLHAADRGPSLRDPTGCLRIAALQHATTLGFICGAVLAAVGTAEEASSGALSQTLLCEPRRLRVAAVKVTAVFVTLLASMLLTFAALVAAAAVESGYDRRPPARAASGAAATASDVGCALLVMAFIAALTVAIALLTASMIISMVLSVTVFVLPLTVLQLEVLWVTPTRWIVEWLHLPSAGLGVIYLADESGYDTRGLPAAIGGALLAVAALVLVFAARALTQRRGARPTEHV